MSTSSSPSLTTSRLYLQQVMPQDQAFIFEGLSHPDVIRFYGVRYHSYESTAAQMEWYQQMLKDGSGIPWKMVEISSGKSIGVITVYFYKPLHKKAEVGFWILPQYWNRGYATEALQEVIRYWKEEKQLHRMEAFVETGNNSSARILSKTGFKKEGTMIDCEIKDGKYISLEIFGWVNRGS